jgi:hypothetical protein
MVDINQLASDYQRWQKQKKEFRRLRDLHHVQDKLRGQQTNDLTMTDINEAGENKTKSRKKKSKSNINSDETTSTTVTTENK